MLMTLPGKQENNRSRASLSFTFLWQGDLIIALLAMCLLIFLTLQPTSAADTSLQSLPKSDGPGDNFPLTEENCQLALFARDKLLADEVLAPLNLGVTVRGGVATLWGTVPSPALAHRAQERIRGVAGLAQIRNDLRISNLDEETAEFIKGPAGGREFVKKTNEEPKIIGSASSSANAYPSSLARRREMTPLVSRSEDFKQATAKSNPPLVMPSIAVPVGPTVSVSSFEPAPHWTPTSPVASSLERLRRNSERFQGIHYDIQGGVVHVWAASARGGDVFTFAQLAARIPGVQRVMVEQNR
jgi:BON domain-containing protein